MEGLSSRKRDAKKKMEEMEGLVALKVEKLIAAVSGVEGGAHCTIDFQRLPRL